MTTARNIIEGAYKIAGMLGAGKTLGADEAADGLTMLIDMLNGMSLADHNIHIFPIISKSLSSGSSFTIGESGTPDWSTERPEWIASAYTDATGIDKPLRIIGKNEYNAIGSKSNVGPPEYLYYDRDYPNGKLYFYPSIGGTAITVTMSVAIALSDAKDLALTTTIDLPRGYDEMLKYNLALRVKPDGVDLDKMTIFIANDSLQKIKIRNAAAQNEPVRLEILRATKRFDINEG